ncbi:MAG: hypothetical protein ACK4NC_00960 [Candidatus Gracilibacteria bacterium]
MKKFLVLYCATKATLEQWNSMTQEEGQAGMDAWAQWQEAHKSELVQPGNPVGKNTRLTKEGTEATSNEVCGYSVVAAESKEAVSALLADNPHLMQTGTYLEIMELMEI